jgi:hypothetical protein
MAKNRYPALFIFLIFLSYFGGKAAIAEDGVKNVEIIEAAINFSQNEFPHVAYLRMELKNNGDKNVANLNFKITYYDEKGYVIKKVVLKNKLTDAIPPGEARKYKIRLNCDVFNERNEEYPYSERYEVDDFDVKILSVKFARK